METDVKERLVGAGILVLLAVLVVPALLSGPKPSVPAEPPAAASSRSIEIDLGDPRAGDAAGIAAIDELAPEPQPAAMREPPTGVPDSDASVVIADPARTAAPQPVQAAAPAVSEAVTPASAGWAVQVAALSNREAAMIRVAELAERGYSAFVLEYRAGERVLYRVRVGPEPVRERATALAARLKAEGFEGNVVSHP